jgi:hypothetical protein
MNHLTYRGAGNRNLTLVMLLVESDDDAALWPHSFLSGDLIFL